MEEAMFWTSEGKKIRCFLCAFKCLIPEGKTGICQVRVNESGILKLKNYGKIISKKIEPIEKIPFYHFFPNSQTLSISSVGTNFEWDTSPSDKIKGNTYTPEDIVKYVNKKKIRIITFYQYEPTISFEFAFKLARLAKRYNIKTTFVTNGYITSEAIKKIGKYLDAVNVQFKASGDPEFYDKYMNVPDVSPIFDALKNFKKHRVFIEISNMIIPGIGDKENIHHKLIEWVVNNLDSSVPYHLLKFTPFSKMKNILETPTSMLEKFGFEAERIGLRFTYIHDSPTKESETTYCYNCREPLILRSNELVTDIKLNLDRCPNCGFRINMVIE